MQILYIRNHCCAILKLNELSSLDFNLLLGVLYVFHPPRKWICVYKMLYALKYSTLVIQIC